MSKKYNTGSDIKSFNQKRFHELVIEMAKKNNCNPMWVYKQICAALQMDIESGWNKVYRWDKGMNAPVDEHIIEDLANFFDIDKDELCERKNGMVKKGKIVKFKLNDIQKNEIMKLKDIVLDALYKNYTSILFEDNNSYLHAINEFPIEIIHRLFNGSQNNESKYFSKSELECIEKEKVEEESYFKSKQNGKKQVKNKPDTRMLDEYRMLNEYKDEYQLCQMIEKSLCILPKEIIDKFVNLISYIPTANDYFAETMFDDFDEEYLKNGFRFFDSKNYKSFNDVIDIANYKNEAKYKKMTEKEKEIVDMKAYSVYNKAYYIHKCINDIITAYCF